MKRAMLMAAVFALFLGKVDQARAGILTTTNDTSATDLANALLAGGAGGVTVTNAVLSSNGTVASGVASSGIYSTSGPNNFQLTGTGIVISSGNAAQDGTTGAFINGVSTGYGVAATAAQTALLTQVSPASSAFFDVTELTITFNAGPTTSSIFFNTVFGSAEYPVYVGAFIDGFGLFLNGKNIAFAGGQPVNIDSSLMVNTGFPTSGGVDGSKYQTTPLGGLLVQSGSPVVTYGGAVTPGSTGNTLIFIVADANDSALDTAAFIQGFGNAPPAIPEPASLTLLAIGGVCTLGFARRRRKQTA